jgi:hypothetical protein
VSEEFAVTCLKEGADDYLLKSNLVRLPLAIQNALKQRELQEQRKNAEAELRIQNEELVKINQDGDTVVLANLKLGYPAGIALSQDEKFLLASGKDPINGSATIIRVDLVSGMPVSFTTGIDNIFEPAGLHRAKNSDKYAWVNSGDDGSVWELGTSQTPACQ